MERCDSGRLSGESQGAEETLKVVLILAHRKVRIVDGVEREGYVARREHNRDDLLAQAQCLGIFFFDPFGYRGVR